MIYMHMYVCTVQFSYRNKIYKHVFFNFILQLLFNCVMRFLNAISIENLNINLNINLSFVLFLGVLDLIVVN